MDDKLTIKQVADTLQVKPQAIYNRIRRGTIEAVKVHDTWLIPVTEVERLRNKGVKRFETDSGHDGEHVLQVRLDEKIEQLEYLKERIEVLEGQLERRDEQLDHTQQLLAMSQKSTQQLADQNQLLLDDQRRQPLWKRLFKKSA